MAYEGNVARMGTGTGSTTRALEVQVWVQHTLAAQRQQLTQALEAAGHRVQARDAVADIALSDLSGADLQVVLMDVDRTAPKALAHCQRLLAAGPQVHVVGYTTRPALAHRLAVLEAGVDVILPAPLFVEEVVAVVRRLALRALRQAQARPEALRLVDNPSSLTARRLFS